MTLNGEEMQIEIELLPEEYDPVVKLLELPDTCFKCEGPVDDHLCWPNFNEAHTIEGSMGYGSKWDTCGFRIAICDACIARGVLKGSLRLIHGHVTLENEEMGFEEQASRRNSEQNLEHAQWILDIIEGDEKWEEYVDGHWYARAEAYKARGDDIPEYIWEQIFESEEEILDKIVRGDEE